jgi:N6-L-threonylcarbamoyladenine synthase
MTTGSIDILGIETSCDETAAAVVRRFADGTGEILADVVLSQLDLHSAFGGVVPELAARSHVSTLDRLVEQALEESGVPLTGIDAVAVTSGPGLIGGLMVGLMTAKAIAMAASKPFLGINHLEGHALTARLTDNVAFPYLLLLVSGGHTQIVLVKGVNDYERWGTTIDDALGEAFDKTAKLLGLGYPGGPAVEQAALSGEPRRFRLPVPMRKDPRLDFSFSGLKTAVRQMAEQQAPLSQQTIADLCLAFQTSVTASIDDRISMALERFAQRFGTECETGPRGRRRRRRQQGDPRSAWKPRRNSRFPLHRPAAQPVHRQRRHDRLGRRRTPGRRTAGRARWISPPGRAGRSIRPRPQSRPRQARCQGLIRS